MRGLGVILLYFAIAASCALVIRKLIRVPDEIFRKLLHFILLGSLLVWTLIYDEWWMAAVTALIFAAAVYPVLKLAERLKNYSSFVTERRQGELKSSLLIVFAMYAAVTAVCWGWRGDRLLTLCSIYAWGFGDAAAALVGKKYGRHHIEGRFVDGRKSMEGTLAMFCVSFVCVALLLICRGGLPGYAYPVIAAVTAAVSAAVELLSKNGMDTITCPLAAMAVLLPLVEFFGG